MLTRLTVVNIWQYIRTSDHYVVLLKLICNSCRLYLNTSPIKPPKCSKHMSQLRSNFLVDTWSGTFITNVLHNSVSRLIFFIHAFIFEELKTKQDAWGHKELDTTKQLNWAELNWWRTTSLPGTLTWKDLGPNLILPRGISINSNVSMTFCAIIKPVFSLFCPLTFCLYLGDKE